MRIVVKLILLLGGLLVVFTLAVAFSGPDGDLRTSVNATLREAMLSTGRPAIGVRVYEDVGDHIVTIDERTPETLVEPYSSWYGYNSGMLTLSVSVYARSIADAVARMLDVHIDQLDHDPSHEGIIVDARVEGYAGLFPKLSNGELIEVLEDAVVAALCETYGLTLEASTRSKSVWVLRAGPDFESKVTIYEKSSSRYSMTTGDGELQAWGASIEAIQQSLSRFYDIRSREGFEDSWSYDVHVTWDPAVPGDLLRALKEQTGMVLDEELRELPHYVLSGTATSQLK